MKSAFVAGVAASILIGAAGLALAADKITPGKYQVQSVMTMTGMPMQIPPQKHSSTNCVTQEDIDRNPEEMFRDDENECAMEDFSMGGGKISYKMQCNSPQGRMTGTGNGTYTADSYDMKMVMKMSMQGMNITSNIDMKGKRIGGC